MDVSRSGCAAARRPDTAPDRARIRPSVVHLHSAFTGAVGSAALAGAIDFLWRLLCDGALRERTRRRQRTLATRYGARRMTSEWLDAYRELAAR
jgi:hypothetical protein